MPASSSRCTAIASRGPSASASAGPVRYTRLQPRFPVQPGFWYSQVSGTARFSVQPGFWYSQVSGYSPFSGTARFLVQPGFRLQPGFRYSQVSGTARFPVTARFLVQPGFRYTRLQPRFLRLSWPLPHTAGAADGPVLFVFIHIYPQLNCLGEPLRRRIDIIAYEWPSFRLRHRNKPIPS